VCFISTACSIVSSVSSGYNITYVFTATYGTSTNFSQTTSAQSVSFTFSIPGTYTLNAQALNSISSQTVLQSFLVVNSVTGISFFSANPYSSSLSGSGLNASFLFTLASGTNYNCSVDYG
jgi:hypothetical protein